MGMDIAYFLVFMLFFEYVCDFGLQSREIAENKSKNLKSLGIHIAGFSFLMLPLMMAGYVFQTAFMFTVMYMCFHALTDMFLWKAYRWSANKRGIVEYWNDKEFDDFIGLDRYLHIASFILLYFTYLI